MMFSFRPNCLPKSTTKSRSRCKSLVLLAIKIASSVYLIIFVAILFISIPSQQSNKAALNMALEYKLNNKVEKKHLFLHLNKRQCLNLINFLLSGYQFLANTDLQQSVDPCHQCPLSLVCQSSVDALPCQKPLLGPCNI